MLTCMLVCLRAYIPIYPGYYIVRTRYSETHTAANCPCSITNAKTGRLLRPSHVRGVFFPCWAPPFLASLICANPWLNRSSPSFRPSGPLAVRVHRLNGGGMGLHISCFYRQPRQSGCALRLYEYTDYITTASLTA